MISRRITELIFQATLGPYLQLHGLDTDRHRLQWKDHGQFIVVFLDFLAQQIIKLDFTARYFRLTKNNAITCGCKAQELVVVEVVVIRNLPVNFQLLAVRCFAGNDKHVFEVPDFIKFDGHSHLGQ